MEGWLREEAGEAERPNHPNGRRMSLGPSLQLAMSQYRIDNPMKVYSCKRNHLVQAPMYGLWPHSAAYKGGALITWVLLIPNYPPPLSKARLCLRHTPPFGPHFFLTELYLGHGGYLILSD